MPNQHKWRAHRSMLLLISGRLAATASGQPVALERSDGSRLMVDNYAEHQATAFVFLSTRSPESRLAVEAIRNVNNRNRRRKIIFAAIFPNPAESGEEMLRFCQA